MKRGTKERLQARRRSQRSVDQYFRTDKYLIPPEQSATFWEYLQNIEAYTPYHHTINSSILSEIAITNTSMSAGERHALLDMSEWDLDEAICGQQEKSSDKFDIYYQNFLTPPGVLRLESQRASIDFFRGMVDGDISLEQRQNYYNRILELAIKASEGFAFFHDTTHDKPNGRASEFIGLAHEFNAQLGINRKLSPTLAAFPTFARGDSGAYMPTQTHDLHIAHLSWGAIQDSITAEVKTIPQPEHFDRYEAVLIGGSLHLHPDHLPDPSYLTELFAKEVRDIATHKDIAALEHISTNVIHVARHGFNHTTQCKDIHSCPQYLREQVQ